MLSNIDAVPRIGGLGGDPKTGKTRFVGAGPRGCPEMFGKKGVYVEIDPDGWQSILPEDRQNWERVTLDNKASLRDELRSVINTPWEKEGFGTVFIDTGSLFCQGLLRQIAAKSWFGANIAIADDQKQPSPGDYTALDNLYFGLLELQKARSLASGLAFWTTYHNHEVRPEPGEPGTPYGGPLLAGKAMTKKVVGWYNTYLRLELRNKTQTDVRAPRTQERVLHTATKGIWLAGLRTGHKQNPIPELIVGDDPAAAWATMYDTLTKPEAK